MFFEHALTTRIEQLQERIESALNTNIRDFGVFQQHYAPRVAALYEEFLENENKTDVKTAMIELLQVETVSALRLYELLFPLSRTDIFNFAHTARRQYDREIFNNYPH